MNSGCILFENRKRKVLEFLEHLHNIMPGNGSICSSLNGGGDGLVKFSPFKNQHFQKDLSGKRFLFVGPDLVTNLMHRPEQHAFTFSSMNIVKEIMIL